MTIGFCLSIGFSTSMNAQKVETITKEAKNVQTVSISGNVDIYIKQGNASTVEIKATKKQHEKMKLEISDNKVMVSYKNQKGKENPIQIYLSVQNLHTIAASSGADVIFEDRIKTDNLVIALSSGSDLAGEVDVTKMTCAISSGSDIDLKNSTADKMEIVASGGSDFEAENLEVKTMNLVISGGSDVDLSGSCEDMNLVASGGSDYTASRFKIKKCNVLVSSGSDADIYVTDELSVVANSSSDVDCKGNPEIINEKISRNSDFDRR